MYLSLLNIKLMNWFMWYYMYCFLKLFSFKLSYILFSKINFNLIIFYFLKIIFEFNRFTGWSWNYSISWFWEFFPCLPCIFILQVINRVGIMEWGSLRSIAFIRVVFQFKLFFSCLKFIWIRVTFQSFLML